MGRALRVGIATGWILAAIFLRPVIGATEQTPARAVIVVSDCGADMDDQWAIAHTAVAPELDLRGVLTTHAPNLKPPPAETAGVIARDTLGRMPVAASIPVIAGSSVPLESAVSPRPNPAVEFLLQEARKHSSSRRLALILIGAATDVASALLTDPSLSDRIEVTAMAFKRWPEGTDTWYVRNDAKAWQALLASGTPLTVGDATLTAKRLRMSSDRARGLLATRGQSGRFLADLLTTWLQKNSTVAQAVTGAADTWPVWDEVTVAHLLGMTRAAAYARPALRDDLTLMATPAAPASAARIGWITEIDSERLWPHLARSLDRARKAFRR
jgi:inosine-uridine nucleoside N-ribohydrolase